MSEADCAHRWVAVPGSNDYECASCGSRKGDTGAIYPPREQAAFDVAGLPRCLYRVEDV